MARRHCRLRRPDGGRPVKSLAALAGILLLAILISPTAADGSRIFLQAGNLTDILRQVSLIGIISLAMTFVILTGGIDLSVGSILALSTSVAAMFLTRGWVHATAHRWSRSWRRWRPRRAGGRAERRGDRAHRNPAVHRHAGQHDRRARTGEMADRAIRTSISASATTWPRSSPKSSAQKALVIGSYAVGRGGVLGAAGAHRIRPPRARRRRQREGGAVRRAAHPRAPRSGCTRCPACFAASPACSTPPRITRAIPTRAWRTSWTPSPRW